MQLKHLFDNFNDANDSGQTSMVARYRERRSNDFLHAQQNYELKQTKKRTKRPPAMALSAEEKMLIKKLGITQAQLRAMKAMQMEEE